MNHNHDDQNFNHIKEKFHFKSQVQLYLWECWVALNMRVSSSYLLCGSLLTLRISLVPQLIMWAEQNDCLPDLPDTLDTTQRDRQCSWASRCRRSADFVTLNSHKNSIQWWGYTSSKWFISTKKEQSWEQFSEPLAKRVKAGPWQMNSMN